MATSGSLIMADAMGWQSSYLTKVALWNVLAAAALGQSPAGGTNPVNPPLPRTAAPTLIDANAYCGSLGGAEPHAAALQTACITALRTSKAMPNYLCDMEVEKYAGFDGTFSGSSFQKVTARARYVDGKDNYEDLKINGKPVTRPGKLLEGTWSDGEFGTNLLMVFKPSNQTEFHYLAETKLKKIATYEFSFAVTKEKNSIWRWTWHGGSVFPGYAGNLWIAAADNRILRVDVRSTDGIPKETPMQSSAGKTEFSYVDFKDGTGFMLPARVEIRSLMRGSREYLQELKFRNCQKFRATSRIVPDSDK